jgi:hypothetical protein
MAPQQQLDNHRELQHPGHGRPELAEQS